MCPYCRVLACTGLLLPICLTLAGANCAMFINDTLSTEEMNPRIW